jgi:hypothetical protein
MDGALLASEALQTTSDCAVPDDVDALRHRCDALCSIVDSLELRLAGVMRPQPPVPPVNTAATPERVRSELASILHEMNCRLDGLMDRLYTMLQRLDV